MSNSNCEQVLKKWRRCAPPFSPLSAKNRRGGHFLPPPPSSARVNETKILLITLFDAMRHSRITRRPLKPLKMWCKCSNKCVLNFKRVKSILNMLHHGRRRHLPLGGRRARAAKGASILDITGAFDIHMLSYMSKAPVISRLIHLQLCPLSPLRRSK